MTSVSPRAVDATFAQGGLQMLRIPRSARRMQSLVCAVPDQRVRFQMIRAYASVAAVAACTVLIGCAGAPVPQTRVGSSAAAIRAAQEVGADNEPQAAYHLRLAQEQRAQGISLINAGDNARAARVLARAESDAEVALALSRESKTRAEANRALEEVRVLRSKL